MLLINSWTCPVKFLSGECHGVPLTMSTLLTSDKKPLPEPLPIDPILPYGITGPQWVNTNLKKGEKIAIEKTIRITTWNSKILKNKSKNRIVIFWQSLPPAKPEVLLREEKGWLNDVAHNSWWHMKCVQHAAHNPKFEKMGLFRNHWWWPWID